MTSHAAGATVRQLVALVFERIDKDKSTSGKESIFYSSFALRLRFTFV